MDFKQAVQTCFHKYVDFSGRASRSEYWYWTLFVLIVDIVAGVLDGKLLGGTFYGLAMLALFLPSLGVSVRRLHDIDRSGWWFLIALVPLVGLIVLIYWFCQKGTDGPNQYGPDPLAMQVLPAT